MCHLMSRTFWLFQYDPAFLVKMGGEKCLVIDEIQKAPELVSRIKLAVDFDHRPALGLCRTGKAW